MGILRDGIKGGGCLRLLIMVVMVVCGPSVCTEYLRCFHSKLLSLLASLSHLPLQASRVVCLHTHTHTHTHTHSHTCVLKLWVQPVTLVMSQQFAMAGIPAKISFL